MSMSSITDIIENRNALYDAGNGDGDGDVVDHSDMECLHDAENTTDVGVYTDGAAIYLVGTDGSGSGSSEWTVTVLLSD